MSKVEITEYALRCAAAEYREAMLAILPKPSECEHEFSDEYCEKRDALIRKTERRSSLRRICKNAAAVFLVCFLGAGAILGINGEARADFLRWVREVYENSFIYHFAGETTEAPLPDCELTWIPEGYELTVHDRDENSLTMVYENEVDAQIIFSCYRMTENSLMQVGLTGSVASTQIKNEGYDAEMFEDDDGGFAILWTDDNGFVYMISANKLEKMEIMHIFDNLKLVK